MDSIRAPNTRNFVCVLIRFDNSMGLMLQKAVLASDVPLFMSSDVSSRLPTNLHFFQSSLLLGDIKNSSVFASFTFRFRALRLSIVCCLMSSSIFLFVAAKLTSSLYCCCSKNQHDNWYLVHHLVQILLWLYLHHYQ